MIERVRAIVLTPNNTMLTIKRTKPGTASYWVLPGGHTHGAVPPSKTRFAANYVKNSAEMPPSRPGRGHPQGERAAVLLPRHHGQLVLRLRDRPRIP